VQTHYEQTIKPIVDRDPEVIAARERVAKLEKELLDAKAKAANALSLAIQRAQQ
jgi:hypothetical protein